MCRTTISFSGSRRPHGGGRGVRRGLRLAGLAGGGLGGLHGADWLSGSAAAAAKGNWSSAAARAGIWHKSGMILVVLVAAVTDCVLGVTVEHLPMLGLGLHCAGAARDAGVVYLHRAGLHRRERHRHGRPRCPPGSPGCWRRDGSPPTISCTVPLCFVQKSKRFPK